MARHIFFSFHYQRDIWRVSRIRNSWVTQGNTTAGFWDDASWESVKRQGEQAIQSWINNEMKGTSVTVVLIGAETYNRKYVLYEIQKSYEEGKGLLGIYIHNMKNQNGYSDNKGQDPLSQIDTLRDEYFCSLHSLENNIWKTYDWVYDDGYKNIGTWIEQAAKRAGR